MTNRKRIAFLCHPYHRGGVTRWMADAAIALSEKELDVYFITVEPVKEFFSGQGRETMLQLLNKGKNNVQIITEQVGYEFEFGTDEYRAYVYKKLLCRVPVGTPVILSDSLPAWAAATSLYNSYSIIGVMHADEAVYYDLAKQYFSQVDIMACVSERVQKITKESVPTFNATNIYTIPCGIHLPAVSAISSNEILRLIYVGRISDYQKRTSDLVKIADQLVKDGIQFHLDIIGDSTDTRQALEHKFNEANLGGHVTFKGWLSQKDVAVYLSQSDILLLTSDFEGTPIAMMEALAAGCGMVGTRVSGIEDYEHHPLAADCLGVYAVGDIADAVSKINKVAAIAKEKRAMAARKLAESAFSMDVCLERYMAAIDKIARKPVASPSARLRLADILYSKAIAFARYTKVSMKKK